MAQAKNWRVLGWLPTSSEMNRTYEGTVEVLMELEIEKPSRDLRIRQNDREMRKSNLAHGRKTTLLKVELSKEELLKALLGALADTQDLEV